MNFIKVLGIGSPFGDDQVGWSVAEALKQQISSPFVSIESHDRPGVRLLELMSGAHTVFIIDAVTSGSEAGTIHRFKNKDIFAAENRFSTHEMGVSHALQLGKALNALPDSIVLYGIEIDRTESLSTLSYGVERAVEKVAMQLKQEIVELMHLFS